MTTSLVFEYLTPDLMDLDLSLPLSEACDLYLAEDMVGQHLQDLNAIKLAGRLCVTVDFRFIDDEAPR